MRRRHNRSKGIRRKKSLKSSNAGPVLALAATIFGILGALALIIFVAVPYLLPLLGMEYQMPWQPTPTPAPTARPTPTPHPISTASLTDLQHEVVLTGSGVSEYQWFSDPYAWEDELLFTAGKLVENEVRMDALYSLNMQSSEITRVEAPLENQSYLYPVCNDTWLVYFDSLKNGGGFIKAILRETGAVKTVHRVYVGQPRLQLDGDIIAWVERTGSRMDKIFLSDLNTLENTTVRAFNNLAYGQSGISLANGELLYADVGTNELGAEGQEISSLSSVNIASGRKTEYLPETYAHDPMTNGQQWAWRNGSHSPTDSLYWTIGLQPPKLLATGITDFGISDTFLAFCKDESISVFLFTTQKEYKITPDGERAQLLGVSNGVVIWMDVTSRERDIMKYACVENIAQGVPTPTPSASPTAQ